MSIQETRYLKRFPNLLDLLDRKRGQAGSVLGPCAGDDNRTADHGTTIGLALGPSTGDDVTGAPPLGPSVGDDVTAPVLGPCVGDDLNAQVLGAVSEMAIKTPTHA